MQRSHFLLGREPRDDLFYRENNDPYKQNPDNANNPDTGVPRDQGYTGGASSVPTVVNAPPTPPPSKNSLVWPVVLTIALVGSGYGIYKWRKKA